MTIDFLFLLNSAVLGLGLAMDAFTVSVADGLADPGMSRRRRCLIAGVFAGFQALMPMLGWVSAHTLLTVFSSLARFFPWIALALLCFVGGKMIAEGVRACREKENARESPCATLGFLGLAVQGIATSVDALSVGFTFASYPPGGALISSLIIAVVTFAICWLGMLSGRRFGTIFSHRAGIAGGVILILIGAEIFLTGIL